MLATKWSTNDVSGGARSGSSSSGTTSATTTVTRHLLVAPPGAAAPRCRRPHAWASPTADDLASRDSPGQPAAASTCRATRPKRTPRELVAQCAPALATTLPLRRRSSPKTRPPIVVNPTVAATTTALPPPPTAPETPRLVSPRPSAGKTCHSPNSTEVVTSTCHGRQ